MLKQEITGALNRGEMVVAELDTTVPSTRRFVRILPIAKPGVPREEHRYLNSRWPIWEYWDFEFRRLLLRDGWETDEWNFDRYILDDERRISSDSASFEKSLQEWVPTEASFQKLADSVYPE